ncbi:MAG: SHOCT domain-containing protein [Deltaproteobacteria bacterium]|nr:SHOCT domain-containing protein [Deltaproteobacteria bacterium]
MRNFLILLIIIAFSVGCTACTEAEKIKKDFSDQLQSIGTDRYLDDHEFVSPADPPVRITMDRTLDFIGTVEESRNIERQGGVGTARDEARMSKVSHLFGLPGTSGVLKEGVVIRIYSLIGDPSLVTFDSSRNWIDTGIESGNINILGDEYRYQLYTSSRLFPDDEVDILTAKGYTVPECLLVKAFDKRIDFGNKSVLYIMYFEVLDAARCEGMVEARNASPEQKQFLGAFVKRSNDSIRFSPYAGTIGVVTSPEAASSPAVTQPAVTEQPAPAGDITTKLETLKGLLDKGLITEEDYERKKKELLEQF